MTLDTNPQRQIGRQRMLEVLYFLARAGYATTRQLAYYCTGSTAKTKTNMLNRTLAKLLADRLIRERVDRLNSERYVALTVAGARVAAQEIPVLRGVQPAVRDNLRHINPHRTACNGVLARYLRKYPPTAGHVVLSELEIASSVDKGRMPYWSFADNAYLTKVADLWVDVLRDNTRSKYWVEVENSYRSPRDLARLASFCRQWYRSKFPFTALVFYVTEKSASSIKIRLERALWEAADEDIAASGNGEFKHHVPEIISRLHVILLDTN